MVDDEPQIRRFLRASLRRTATHDRGGERRRGDQAAATGAPDVIVLDLGLPDMEGNEVIRRLREWADADHRAVGAQPRGEKVEAFDLGADDFVTKPFGMAELLARIRAALRHRLQEGGERGLPQRRSRRRPGQAAGAARAARCGCRPRNTSCSAARAACRPGGDPPAPAARGVARPGEGDAVSARLCRPAARQARGRSARPAPS